VVVYLPSKAKYNIQYCGKKKKRKREVEGKEERKEGRKLYHRLITLSSVPVAHN
jgi:hypothetical protein